MGLNNHLPNIKSHTNLTKLPIPHISYTMEHPHFSSSSPTKEEDQTNNVNDNVCKNPSPSSSVRRIHAKTNKANGTFNLCLHGSILESREMHMKDENNNEELLPKDPDGGGGGRERLKRHREEVAGRVLIPDTWGQEGLLKDWIDCSAFEALMVPNKIASARKALVADNRRSTRASNTTTSHQQLRIESRC